MCFLLFDVQMNKKTTSQKDITVLVHHVLSNVCFLGALFTTRMHFWACLDGICEVTNPPLSLIFFLKVQLLLVLLVSHIAPA